MQEREHQVFLRCRILEEMKEWFDDLCIHRTSDLGENRFKLRRRGGIATNIEGPEPLEKFSLFHRSNKSGNVFLFKSMSSRN